MAGSPFEAKYSSTIAVFSAMIAASSEILDVGAISAAYVPEFVYSQKSEPGELAGSVRRKGS
jgi:hypothetical protein